MWKENSLTATEWWLEYYYFPLFPKMSKDLIKQIRAPLFPYAHCAHMKKRMPASNIYPSSHKYQNFQSKSSTISRWLWRAAHILREIRPTCWRWQFSPYFDLIQVHNHKDKHKHNNKHKQININTTTTLVCRWWGFLWSAPLWHSPGRGGRRGVIQWNFLELQFVLRTRKSQKSPNYPLSSGHRDHTYMSYI